MLLQLKLIYSVFGTLNLCIFQLLLLLFHHRKNSLPHSFDEARFTPSLQTFEISETSLNNKMAYKLVYFNGRGRAERSRILFYLAKEKVNHSRELFQYFHMFLCCDSSKMSDLISKLLKPKRPRANSTSLWECFQSFMAQII